MKKSDYEAELEKLQIELIKLQEWIKSTGAKVIVVFEGRDTAGKGGVIKRITQHLSPRIVRIAALPKPTERERTQFYFQRYVAHFPAGGEMVLFDRSWYNRSGVEKVLGFCDDEEHREFLDICPKFERMIVASGVILIKYWFQVSHYEQEERFNARTDNPLKRWKLSPIDLMSREKWYEYSLARDETFAHTNIEEAPWHIVHADDKKTARLNCIHHLLSQIPYSDTLPEKIELPALSELPDRSDDEPDAGVARVPLVFEP